MRIVKREYNPLAHIPNCQVSIGIDPSFGSSKFGIVATRFANERIEVIEAEEYESPDFNDMINGVEQPVTPIPAPTQRTIVSWGDLLYSLGLVLRTYKNWIQSFFIEKREILTDPMEFGKVVLEEKKSIKKMKMEKVLAQS